MISPYRRQRLAEEFRDAQWFYVKPNVIYDDRPDVVDYAMCTFFWIVTVGMLPLICHLVACVRAFCSSKPRYQSNAENWDAFMQEVDSNRWVDIVRAEKSP